jgi:hypothetical protein
MLMRTDISFIYEYLWKGAYILYLSPVRSLPPPSFNYYIQIILTLEAVNAKSFENKMFSEI